MFKDKFEITNSVDDQLFVNEYNQKNDLLPGIYERGLLTLIGTDLARQITFENWGEELSSGMFDVVAYTAFGDLFVLDKKTKLVSLFEVQVNQITNIEIDLDIFFNDFLIDKHIGAEVLKIDYFNEILSFKRLEIVEYGECLVLKPWLLLGGKECVDNYSIANFPIYLDLVGQTVN